MNTEKVNPIETTANTSGQGKDANVSRCLWNIDLGFCVEVVGEHQQR